MGAPRNGFRGAQEIPLMRSAIVARLQSARMPLIAVCAVVLTLPAIAARRDPPSDPIPSIRIPAPVMPSPNAFETYQIAVAAVTDRGYESQANATAPIETRQAIIAANTRALKLVALANAEEFEAPPVRSFSTSNAAVFTSFLTLARLLAFKSVLESDRAQWDTAAETALEAIMMGARVQHDGVLIQRLAGMNIAALGRAALARAVTHMTADEARHAARALRAAERITPNYADAVAQEGYLCMSALYQMMESEIEWRETKRVCYAGAPAPSNEEIMEECVQYFDHAIDEAGRPYRAAKRFYPPEKGILADIVVFDTRFAFVYDRIQNDLLIGRLALQYYHAEHGAYPDTLAPALSETGKIGRLDDLFAASGTLRYVRTANGYRLYSVGPDGKDDGGTAIVTGSQAPVGETSAGDIVVGVD